METQPRRLGIITIIGVAAGLTAAARAQETPAASTQPPPPELARAMFERLTRLDGAWDGRSTKGWRDTCRFQTIAAGSCVLQTSFDAHPNETMVTLYFLDGDTLKLTHYCVARNQPTLRATQIAPDLSRVVFTFESATNLASRDVGHMDQCVIELAGPDRFASQWTWYQQGEERWMERIERTRAAQQPAASKDPATEP